MNKCIEVKYLLADRTVGNIDKICQIYHYDKILGKQSTHTSNVKKFKM